MLKVPDSVTVVAVRVHAMPLASVPLAAAEPFTSNRSPVCGLVNVMLELCIVALDASKMELSVSAMATGAPFSV